MRPERADADAVPAEPDGGGGDPREGDGSTLPEAMQREIEERYFSSVDLGPLEGGAITDQDLFMGAVSIAQTMLEHHHRDEHGLAEAAARVAVTIRDRIEGRG